MCLLKRKVVQFIGLPPLWSNLFMDFGYTALLSQYLKLLWFSLSNLRRAGLSSFVALLDVLAQKEGSTVHRLASTGLTPIPTSSSNLLHESMIILHVSFSVFNLD